MIFVPSFCDTHSHAFAVCVVRQAKETADQEGLSSDQAEKAELLIRELREQNEKGEAYFEREKDALQAQVGEHRIDLCQKVLGFVFVTPHYVRSVTDVLFVVVGARMDAGRGHGGADRAVQAQGCCDGEDCFAARGGGQERRAGCRRR